MKYQKHITLKWKLENREAFRSNLRLRLHWQKKSDNFHIWHRSEFNARVWTKIRTRFDFFHIRSESFPNVVLNQISVHPTYIKIHISDSPQNFHARARRLLINTLNASVLYALAFYWNGNVIKGKKLHIQELVFNPCPVNFENTTAKSYIIFLSNEVFVVKPTSLFAMRHNHSACTWVHAFIRSLSLFR